MFFLNLKLWPHLCDLSSDLQAKTSPLRCLPVLPMLDHHTHSLHPPGIAAPLAKNHTMNPTAPISTITGGINLKFIKASQLSFAVDRLGEVPTMIRTRMIIMRSNDEIIRNFYNSLVQQRKAFEDIQKSS